MKQKNNVIKGLNHKFDDEILSQLKDYESIYKHKEKNNLLHSFIKLFIALVLLFLIVFYSGAFFRMFYVFESKSASSLISNDGVINFKDINITIDNLVYKNILAIYDSSNGNEIKICLLGNIDEKNYHVTALYIPKIISQSGIHVTSVGCDENTIISLHSHPIDNCFFSNEDISSYNDFKNIRPDGIIGLMCSKQRFNFFMQ